MKEINWGILGTGYIAQEFAQDLRRLPEAKLLAVGSRKLEVAQAFAHQFQIPRAYQSYEELVTDKDVDIVYIATPNTAHKDNCILCLEAGKAVLCEKPFTLNAKDAHDVIELARDKKLFCMEAMWTRFIPLVQKVREMINDGVIGDIKMFTADFGLQMAFDENDRHFNLKLGGGALLDIGIYPISLAFYLLGKPSNVVSQATLGKTQVDEQSSLIFQYANGQLATLYSSFLTNTPNEVIIMGSQGQLRIHAPIYRPYQLSIQQFTALSSSSSKIQPGWKSTLKQIALVRKFYNYLSRLVHKPKKIRHSLSRQWLSV
ncbi:oxidoreductase family [Beggiatoa sp. PS]|nr:oxidoreductase family [Beggiatoa sp. PS]